MKSALSLATLATIGMCGDRALMNKTAHESAMHLKHKMNKKGYPFYKHERALMAKNGTLNPKLSAVEVGEYLEGELGLFQMQYYFFVAFQYNEFVANTCTEMTGTLVESEIFIYNEWKASWYDPTFYVELLAEVTRLNDILAQQLDSCNVVQLF